MKNIILTLSLISTSAFAASECEIKLQERVQNDPNITLVQFLDSYSCEPSACAVVYEKEGYQNERTKMLAFLDLNNGVGVNWIPLNNEVIYGYQDLKNGKFAYAAARGAGQEKLTVRASLETPRDAIFWPPHRVYFKQLYSCVRQ